MNKYIIKYITAKSFTNVKRPTLTSDTDDIKECIKLAQLDNTKNHVGYRYIRVESILPA